MHSPTAESMSCSGRGMLFRCACYLGNSMYSPPRPRYGISIAAADREALSYSAISFLISSVIVGRPSPNCHETSRRHACGYALANKGLDTRTLQAYLGHRSINSTTRYAALAPGRFKNIWGKG
jgi:integrase